jgi:carbon-monoxide dehydrogenase catalytic subunit
MPETEKKAPRKTMDPAAEQMLKKAAKDNVSTAFSRVDEMKPCPIGLTGACCKNCFMGPCRVTKEGSRGICGADAATIVARNLTRSVAAGSAAHSDHGRDVALMLRGIASGEFTSFGIADEDKLMAVAEHLDVATEGREVKDIALDVANIALSNFGRQEGELNYLNRAPAKRQELWRKLDIAPRGIDREIVESMHRTSIGVDTDAEHVLMHSLRTALGDGWGGSMLATDLQDIIFGTPMARRGQVNLGVLKEDHVNIIMHGHEALLSETIIAASRDPELIKLAESKGAKGINLAGICCSSNEVLARQGVPPAGNFLHQELAIITGVVDVMVVDVQCIFQALADVASSYHTKLVATSRKAKVPGAVYMPLDENAPVETAKEIVKLAIENYPNRKDTEIPDYISDLVAGFSHEYIRYMLGGKYRATLRPLNDAIMEGRIMGLAGVVGCNNPRVEQDAAHNYIVKELIKNDVLVVQTGCGAVANAKYGMLLPEAMKDAGPGLREIGETVGIPPVLHMGSCVDNSRILTVLSDVVNEGGLGDDISDLPAVGIAPEWMSEKALAIGEYFVASGAYVIFGVGSPVSGSAVIEDIINNKWQEQLHGRLEFEPDPAEIVKKALAHIKERRAALGLTEYKPGKYVRIGAPTSFENPKPLQTPHRSS